MKRNLLTLMFVIAFICVGVSVASAKNTSLSANSIAVSKRALVASGKANSLKTRCNTSGPCSDLLLNLLYWNGVYERNCAPDYLVSCDSDTAQTVIDLGGAYEFCLNAPWISKNIDKKMDQDKIEKPQNVMSK